MPDLERRALVVDDEGAIRTLVNRVLTRAGFVVVEAVDGQDAIDQLREHDFDVLVVDLMMPRVDGLGVIAHLAGTRPAMIEKTVVMTAFPNAAARARVDALCPLLLKPFDVSELVLLATSCAVK